MVSLPNGTPLVAADSFSISGIVGRNGRNGGWVFARFDEISVVWVGCNADAIFSVKSLPDDSGQRAEKLPGQESPNDLKGKPEPVPVEFVQCIGDILHLMDPGFSSILEMPTTKGVTQMTLKEQIKSLRLKVSELEAIYNQVPPPFPAGSMGPKIKAAIEFVKNGGSVAYISKTDLFEETLAGKAGTTVLPG